MSGRHMAEAKTLTRASPADGARRSCSMTWRTSGPPVLETITLLYFMVSPLRDPRLGLFLISGQPVELPTDHEKPNHEQHTVDGVRDTQDGDERFTDDTALARGRV